MSTTQTVLRVEDAGSLTPFERRELARLKNNEFHHVLNTHQCAEGLLVQAAVKSEIYCVQDADLGPLIYFVRQIKDAIVQDRIKYRVGRTKLNEEWYNMVLTKNGVEEDHLKDIPNRLLAVPPIGVMCLNNGLQIIDGSHRIVKRWRYGNPYMRFIMVHFADVLRLGLVTTEVPQDAEIVS